MISRWYLLAQVTRPQELGRRFRGPDSQFGLGDLAGLLLFVVAAAALVWLLRWLLQRQSGIHRYYHPRRLFLQLCRAHGLSSQERKLLWQLAQFLQLEHPATLFLLAELWEPAELGEDWAPWAETLQRLRTRIFGTGDPETPAHTQTEQHPRTAPPAETFLTEMPLELETPTA